MSSRTSDSKVLRNRSVPATSTSESGAETLLHPIYPSPKQHIQLKVTRAAERVNVKLHYELEFNIKTNRHIHSEIRLRINTLTFQMGRQYRIRLNHDLEIKTASPLLNIPKNLPQYPQLNQVQFLNLRFQIPKYS